MGVIRPQSELGICPWDGHLELQGLLAVVSALTLGASLAWTMWGQMVLNWPEGYPILSWVVTAVVWVGGGRSSPSFLGSSSCVLCWGAHPPLLLAAQGSQPSLENST